MGKITQSISVKEITDIITSQMASMEVSASTQVTDRNITFQMNQDSTNCKNRKITFNNTQYVSYSTVFQSSVAVQSLQANITNDIIAKLQSSQTGGTILPTSTQQKLAATIRNTVTTTLTQEAITTFNNTLDTVNVSVQVCRGSDGGGNFIFGTYNQVFTYYQQVYTQMDQVQHVSADIANTIDADFSAEQTGIVAMLTRMITVICIVLIIVAAIVVVVVLFGLVV